MKPLVNFLIQLWLLQAVFGTSWSHKVKKRFVLGDNMDGNEQIVEMHQQIKSLQSSVQELTQYVGQLEGNHAGQSGRNCNCEDNKGGPTYIRWGRKDCPGNGTELVYTGMAGGGHFTHRGAAAEYICLPLDPDNLPQSQSKTINVVAFVYGAEYEDTYFNTSPNDDVPCAVCMPNNARSVIMIPGKSRCYPGWKREYSGKLASGYYNHVAASQYVCVDLNGQFFNGGGLDMNGKLFYGVEAVCGSLRCPPYKQHAKLPCVVCSK